MNIEIRKYNPSKDYEKLLELIHSEGEDWKEYLNSKYKLSLESSITYVAYIGTNLCGYSRSILDIGFYIWIIDLLVHKNFRGNSIGQKLMERTQIDFPDLDVYVLSDVDNYYKKIGYKKEGTIFKINS